MNSDRILAILDEIEKGIGEIRAELDQMQNATGQVQDLAEAVDSAELLPPEVLELIGEQNPVREIIGGVPTINFPDCCAVGQEGNYFCTGTLIAPTVVVTANHCENVTHVFIGGNDVLEPHTGQTIRVIEQYSHYDCKVDLRVLVLEEAVQGIQPRHIAQGTEVGNPTEAIVVGFGNTNPRGTRGYGIKRIARVPIKSLDCTNPADAVRYGGEAGKELVAGHLGLRVDTCKGDSGGPLYIKEPQSGEYYLLGATARGAKNARNECGDGGIYVRVDLYVEWIREVTGIDIEGPRLY